MHWSGSKHFSSVSLFCLTGIKSLIFKQHGLYGSAVCSAVRTGGSSSAVHQGFPNPLAVRGFPSYTLPLPDIAPQQQFPCPPGFLPCGLLQQIPQLWDDSLKNPPLAVRFSTFGQSPFRFSFSIDSACPAGLHHHTIVYGIPE